MTSNGEAGAPLSKAEKDEAARRSLLECFGGKICPPLSMGAASTTREAPLITGALGAPAAREGELIGCQGPNCMWFTITAVDGEQRILRGGCSVALLPSAVQQVQGVLSLAVPNIKLKHGPSVHRG